MTWLNKILHSEDSHQPTAAAQRAVPAVRPAADPQQLRQRLALAASAEEAAQLEHELGAALAQLRQTPLPEDPARVRGQAVILLTDKPDALSWLAELADEAVLVEVALHARFAEVRLGAARRLASSAALERVAQASRDKDKGVYRHCSTLLHERQAASDCAVRAIALERELEILLAEDPVAASRLVDLEKEFRQLAGIDPGRCTELMAQFRLRAHEQAHQLQLVHARLLAAQALAAELELPAALSMEQWQQLQSRWRELAGANAWPAAPAWLTKHKEALALTQLQGAIETRLEAVGEDLQRLQRCEDFLASHDQDEAIGEELKAAWEALDQPEHPQLRADLQARWEACLKRHVKPAAPVPPPLPQPAAAPPARDNTLLLQFIGQMADAIEQGHLAQAGKLDAEIVKIEAASGLPRAQAQRLVGLRAQLLKLRGWARWGSDQARQQLILQAEQLAQDSQDVASLAKAITKLRQEWKSLDAHGASNKALWAQFDAAVEKAYVPVAAHRAELAAKLQVARLARQALCLEWENWLAQIVWEHADIKAIQTMRQEICDAWRGAGTNVTRERRSLHKRFEAILAGLDANIEAARRQEISRCEALIAAAQALRQETRLRQAIEGIKALQQRWRDEALSVRLARAEQQQLWQGFRSACDAVFARRGEEKKQQTAQRAQQREAVQLRLTELQAALGSQEIGQVQQRIADFRAAWREDRATSAPAKEALQQAEAHLQALQAQKRQAPYQLLAQKIALIEELESAAVAGAEVAVQLSEVRETWKTLPRLSAKLEQPLARRLAAAPGVTASGLAAGGKLREGLLAELEIALGLRSEAHDESRRNRNLQLLQQKFRRDQPPPVDLDKLVADWHAAAAAPDTQQQQRMALILQTMGKALLNTGL